MKSFGALCTVLIGAVSVATVALGQHWPTRPITVVSPFVAGTTNDLVAQIVLGPVGQQIGQPFLLENHPGGDGTAGVESVVKSNPDGYTLLLSSSAMSAAILLHKAQPYDLLHDLAPIAMFGGEPSMLVAAPRKGYTKVADLVAAAKAKPGEIKFASVGVGSASYIAGERFRLAAELNVQHVPYPGPVQALADLMAGRTDFYFIPVIPALALITEGKVVPLAVSTPNRLQSLPGLQTLAEAGYSMTPYLTWCGLSAPADVARDVIDELNVAIVKVLGFPAVRKQLLRVGFEPSSMSPDQYEKFIADDLAAAAKLAKDVQIAPSSH